MTAPARSNLLESQLKALRGKRVKVFITSGRGYTGELKGFDDDVLVLGPHKTGASESTVMLDQVSAFREAAPDEW